MTKLLVISDVHRDRYKLERILNKYKDQVNHIISLGDSECSTEYLQKRNIIAVKGNYPFDGGEGYHKILQIEQVKIFLTHGHKFGVKWGSLSRLHDYASSEDFDLVMYGHTHEASLEKEEGITYLNPGSVRQSRGKEGPSFAMVTIKNKNIEVQFFDAERLEEITL